MSRNTPVTRPVSAFVVVLQTLFSAAPARASVFEADPAGIAVYRVPEGQTQMKPRYTKRKFRAI